jgi:urea transporter/murein DD-endopeptidase MepM/ murein hydrolase activator NlpD
MQFIIDSILFSYSQIFFCNRRWFGAVALISTFIVPEIGLLGLVGLAISNFISILLKFDKEKIRSGFYGFNGLLFGAAAAYFFELTPFLILIVSIFIVITFFLSAAMEHFLASVFNLPGLSLPFISALYIYLIFITNYNTIIYKGFNFVEYSFLSEIPEIFTLYLKSISLILFQSSAITGIILIVGILFFSRVMFVNSIIGFSINYIFANIIFPNPSSDLLILTSFNSILASFALGGNLVIISRKSLGLIFISTLMVIVFTGFFTQLLADYLLPVLVLPFNVVVLFTIYSLKFRQEHSDLALIYFQPGSPEENFYYHQNRKTRFEKFKYIFPELPVFGEWKISQGFDGDYTHKDDWKYAWDFVIEDEKNNEYSESGNFVEDYYCYNTPVVASLDGDVVKVIDNVPENKIGETNLQNNWGNTVIIDNGDGLFSAMSHLKMNSMKVSKGDIVKKGDIIGLCGNNGRSPTPHLHFQFQLTDKLGDKTYQFPISHYLEKNGNRYELKSFSYPTENAIVRNIETHKGLTEAFDFQLGDEYVLECNLNENKFTEHWEVKVDIQNNMFIESVKGAKVFLYPREKVFYLTNFIGNKKSALYYFYLQAISVPLGYVDNLFWKDSIPVSISVNNITSYVAELFLLFGQLIHSKVEKTFEKKINGNHSFIVVSKFQNYGRYFLKWFVQESTGKLYINTNGSIDRIEHISKKEKFSASIKAKEN